MSDIEKNSEIDTPVEEGQKSKFSYSRLSMYRKCPFAYDLKYNQKKFFDPPTLVTLLGTLIHHNQEKISLSLKEGKSPNYSDLIDELYNINIPKKSPQDTEGGIYGVNILKDRYTEEYYTPSDKTGMTYFGKVNDYIANIRRQEEFMVAHPELEIFDIELEFLFPFGGEEIKGFIDRVLKYKGLDKYQVYDVKTRDRLFEKQDITTPLQHVVYGLALKHKLKLKEVPDECFYDMVFIREMQPAGTKGFINRGIKQLEKAFDGIRAGEFAPKPSPLCHWCEFCNTNPKVTEQGANCCPYYSKWTPNNSTHEIMNKWTDGGNTEELIEKLKNIGKIDSKFFGFAL